MYLIMGIFRKTRLGSMYVYGISRRTREFIKNKPTKHT